QIAGGLDDRGTSIADPPPGRLPEPFGDPGPCRDLREALGERHPRARGLATPPAALVPEELQPPFSIRQIAGPGQRRTLDPGSEDPAGRTGPRRRVRCGEVD